MGDDRLRQLERRYKETLGLGDEVRWLRARAHAGALTRQQIALAGFLGDRAARHLAGLPATLSELQAPPASLSTHERAQAARDALAFLEDPALCQRLAVAMAQAVWIALPRSRRERGAFQHLDHALVVAGRFSTTPESKRRATLKQVTGYGSTRWSELRRSTGDPGRMIRSVVEALLGDPHKAVAQGLGRLLETQHLARPLQELKRWALGEGALPEHACACASTCVYFDRARPLARSRPRPIAPVPYTSYTCRIPD